MCSAWPCELMHERVKESVFLVVVLVEGRTSVGSAVTQRPAARAACSHNAFHQALRFFTFSFCFFSHLALQQPTAQLVWPRPRGTVGTAAERCSWRRGCFLSSPAIGRLLTQHGYYCSHPELPASVAAPQMAFAGCFFLLFFFSSSRLPAPGKPV